jgi:hypothetical protein
LKPVIYPFFLYLSFIFFHAASPFDSRYFRNCASAHFLQYPCDVPHMPPPFLKPSSFLHPQQRTMRIENKTAGCQITRIAIFLSMDMRTSHAEASFSRRLAVPLARFGENTDVNLSGIPFLLLLASSCGIPVTFLSP